MFKKYQKAFTLIELLVVVAIIGVLASVVLASLGDARANARDAKRAGDMKQLQTAFELYYNDHGQYPNWPGGGAPVCGSCIEGADQGNWGDVLDYLDPIPVDPTRAGSTSGYRYAISNVNGRKSYTMLVKLEKNNGAWCSIGMSPGWTNWVNNYDQCEF